MDDNLERILLGLYFACMNADEVFGEDKENAKKGKMFTEDIIKYLKELKRWRKFGEDLECFTNNDPQILEVLEKVRGKKDE